MRVKVALPCAVLVAAMLVACDDQQPTPPIAPRATSRAALTLENLPKNASSVCRANVEARDALDLSGKFGVDADAQRLALGNVIADVCY